ncbi:MAG: sel1 repeat family protein, partial [Planctomycetes bacterium]|nr:sel1 repeat family protein [Planctomycetota bacterium]
MKMVSIYAVLVISVMTAPLMSAGDPNDWYQETLKKAEQGHAAAQYNLGVMYANGQGVPQDYKEAVKWFRKAAEQGDADAQFNLGLMYANGRGVPQDDKEAVKWFRKAAEQGDADAQFNLGLMY